MFENDYDYEYDSDDIEDLFDDYDYDYEDDDEVEYENYYHNITEELVDEQPFFSGQMQLGGTSILL